MDLCRLVIPDNIGDSDKVIVFVHGLEGGASTFSPARRVCTERGIVPLTFDYPNDGPAQQAASDLCKKLSDLSGKHPTLRLVIVAHSLGGLITVLAVCDPQFPPDLVTDVFTLGTPFRGSSIAEFQSEAELSNVVWRLTKGDWDAVDTVNDGRGEAARDILPNSKILRRIREHRIPETIRIPLGAGSKSYLNDEGRELLRRELPSEMRRLRVSSAYTRKLERLLKSDEIKDGRGDGAVTVESATALDGAHCKRVFEVTHSELAGTPDRAKQVFSWILQEMQW